MGVAGLIFAIISAFLLSMLDEVLNAFSEIFVDIMALAIDVLDYPLVVNGIGYVQVISLALLGVKVVVEGIQTYLLYQNGDPDSDPIGLLSRSAQSVIIITTLPWIVREVFKFGNSIANDVATLSAGTMDAIDMQMMMATVVASGGFFLPFLMVIVVVLMIILGIQAAIRGGELALASFVGPALALNISSSNRSVWSSWFKSLLILSLTQAVQIFMIKGAFAMVTLEAGNPLNFLFVIGWLWVALKTPATLKQYLHDTGFTGAVGGGAKQAGSMYLMRKMMAR